VRVSAGFGRVGQIVGRILAGWRIPFKAHDEYTLDRQQAVYHEETQLI
jgi:phosphoglycerate dehydrogenase-like enzyme